MESFKLLTKIDNDIFFYIGIIFASHVFLKFASKIFHALKVYAFPTYPDFSKYGKWSGKYLLSVHFLLRQPSSLIA